jgi:hypothetical protein
VWSVDKHYNYIVSTGRDDWSINYGGRVMTREAPGGGTDVIYRQETMVTSSMRPIVHQILDLELTWLAQCLELIGKVVSPRSIAQLRVDGIVVTTFPISSRHCASHVSSKSKIWCTIGRILLVTMVSCL